MMRNETIRILPREIRQADARFRRLLRARRGDRFGDRRWLLAYVDRRYRQDQMRFGGCPNAPRVLGEDELYEVLFEERAALSIPIKRRIR